MDYCFFTTEDTESTENFNAESAEIGGDFFTTEDTESTEILNAEVAKRGGERGVFSPRRARRARRFSTQRTRRRAESAEIIFITMRSL